MTPRTASKERLSESKLRFLIRQETETSLHHAREAQYLQQQLNDLLKKKEARIAGRPAIAEQGD